MSHLPPAGDGRDAGDEPMAEDWSASDAAPPQPASGPATPLPPSQPGTPMSVATETESSRSATATPVPSNPGTPRPPGGDAPPPAPSRPEETKPRPPPPLPVPQPRPVKAPPSKYGQLLAIIEDLGKDIRPTYAGSKSSAERLKRGIVHARILVRECLLECERAARS